MTTRAGVTTNCRQPRQERPAPPCGWVARTTSEFDDPAFLALLRQGDQRAYQRLIRRFHGSLVGVAAGDHRQPRPGRRGGAGRLARRARRHRPVRGPVQPDHLAVQHRAEPRPHARQPRGAAGRVCRTWRTAGSRGERAVPLSAFQPDGHWVEAPRLWDEISPGAHRRRPPALGSRAGGDRAPARGPARRADPARHRSSARPRRRARCWRSARRTSACCCTGRAAGSARRSIR